MMASVIPCLKGAALYVVLCALASLTGRGLARLCRLTADRRTEWLLAPVLSFLFWSLALGVAAGAGLPIKYAAPVLWGASGLLAVYGLWRPWPNLRTAWPLLLCAVLPVAVMARPFAVGLTQDTDTVALDGWTYMAGGHYLWEHPRGIDAPGSGADLSLLDQVGASFNGQRYLSFTLLAFFSPLVRAGDTCAVAALHQAWTLFSLGGAVFLFWRVDGQRPGPAAVATAVALLGGWIATAVWGNNFDQLLALVYMPALAATMHLWEARDWRRWLLLGALLAGAWYTYPECAPFVIGGAALIALPRLWAERRAWPAWVGSAAALLVAGLLLLPAAATLLRFAHRQYAEVFTGTRQIGYEMYCGLLNPAYQPAAFWGLGGETYAKPHTAAMHVCGVLLSVLLAAGLFALVHRGRWGIAAAVVFLLGGALYFLVGHPYPYAAFKVLSVAWWCVAGALVIGATAILERIPGRLVRHSLAAVLILGTGGLVELNRVQKPLWPSGYGTLRAGAFRQVRSVRQLVSGEPVLIAVSDWLPNLLAIYYLRELPLAVVSPRAWLLDSEVVHCTPGTGGAPPDAVRYVLTDDNAASTNDFVHYGRLVWTRKPYRLWELEPASTDAEVVHIDSPYGLGRSTAGDFMWLGAFDTALYVRSQRAGALCLQADFRLGPNLPGPAARLRLSTGDGFAVEVVVKGGADALTLPVHAGMNKVVLRPLDPPTASPPGGDPRTLLVEVIGLRISLNSGTYPEPSAEVRHLP
jgi:hypothetical protein